jgi:lipopolysaccharide export system protein LptC
MVRRRQIVYWVKRLLPVVAVLLLGSIALWPEIVRQIEMNNVAGRRGSDLQAGKLTNVRYRGTDERNRPYTVTARQAVQDGPERINLVDPKGDLVSENGSWTLIQSNDGVYIQHAGLLDLSHDVRVYRDDGITLNTDSATMDLKTGAAAGNEQTHAEGPFGTLDAQGFALVDKGAIIQFQGSSRLLLNEARP